MSTPDVVRRTRLANLRNDVAVAAVLVVVWTLLWGELSLANVVSGALVALLVLVAFPVDHAVKAVRHRFNPIAAVRLGAFFFSDLVMSKLVTAAAVVRQRSRVRTGIGAVPLRVEHNGPVPFPPTPLPIPP